VGRAREARREAPRALRGVAQRLRAAARTEGDGEAIEDVGAEGSTEQRGSTDEGSEIMTMRSERHCSPPPSPVLEPAVAPAPSLRTVAICAREVATKLHELANLRDKIMSIRVASAVDDMAGSIRSARLGVALKIRALVAEIHRAQFRGAEVPIPKGIKWNGSIEDLWSLTRARVMSGAESIADDVCEAIMIEAWAKDLEGGERDTEPGGGS
jgi:hypothetical protein